MAITLVPDPTWKGDPKHAPQMPRAWAMRKMFEAGSSVGDIARHFKVSYNMAYKSIKPPKQAHSSTHPTKELSPERLKGLTKSQLEKIAYTRNPTPEQRQRIKSAVDELDRRFPDWMG